MQTNEISPQQVRYNAANQSFEARVTLHSAEGTRSYACTIPGDLSMPLDQAITALKAEAMTRHRSQPGLYSAERTLAPVALRAPARPSWRKRLLRALPGLRSTRAA